MAQVYDLWQLTYAPLFFFVIEIKSLIEMYYTILYAGTLHLVHIQSELLLPFILNNKS